MSLVNTDSYKIKLVHGGGLEPSHLSKKLNYFNNLKMKQKYAHKRRTKISTKFKRSNCE